MTKKVIPLVYLIVVLLGMGACKKAPPPAVNPITPLQSLINTDTTLTLYHRLLLVANESVLLADNAVTLLVPTNAALRAAGYSETVIDSLAPSVADRIVSFHFINQVVLPDSNGYVPYPTHLGFSLYGELDGNKQLWFNGIPTTGDTSMRGKALVYRLNGILLSPYDSLTITLNQDSTLTFAAELFRRTGLDTTLTQAGSPFTILAPTNVAFMAAGYDSLSQIDSGNVNLLTDLAKFHVVPNLYFSNLLSGITDLTTLQGGSLSVSASGGVLQLKGNGNSVPANVLTGNQPAGNHFVIYKIDELLSP